MKTSNLIIPAFILLLGASCNRQAGEGEKNQTQGNTELEGQLPAAQQASTEENVKHGTIKLTRQDFLAKVMNYEVNQTEWVFEGDKPCLVDFYADWCAPCRTTSPILEELAVEYGDKINFYKVDTQKEQELAMIFGIQSIPTFLFCPMEGRPVMSSGIAQTREQTKEMFRQQIEEILLKNKS